MTGRRPLKEHFALDALDAGKGDALVLRWGTDEKPHVALVDGGPSGVYARRIQPHLAATAGVDPAGAPKPVVLDLVVVSHVDDDHIRGVIDLATAIDTAQKQSTALPATVDEVWHNAFADLQLTGEIAQEPELGKTIGEVVHRPEELVPTGAVAREDRTVGDITAGAASIAQGRQLDHVLRTIRVPRNASFPEGFARDGTTITRHGLRLTVLAPNSGLLDLLRTQWKKELAAILEKERSAQRKTAAVSALAAAFDDPSVPNQSSIVVLAEFSGKSMLLTGDARGDHIIRALRDRGTHPLKVDLFKVPHHCSAHTNGVKLFEAVVADHYVISANGEHGNPHPAALEALFTSQRGRPITLHLTNRPESGARKPDDKAKAKQAQQALDDAAEDPNVTIVYRDETARGLVVELL